MRIYAFQGLRYSRSAEDPEALAAPPFDQIDDALRDRLHRSSVHHFAHLTRPVPGNGEDPYQRAATLHARWQEEGVIERDTGPSLYPYAVELPDGSRRLGLCCLIEVQNADLRPHEETVEKPLADRLALLRATRVDLEPVMLLAEDTGELETLLSEEVEASSPLVRHRDSAGNKHLLFRTQEAERITAYQETLGDRFAAIADGHHRCKVAQLFAQEVSAQAGTPASAKLAVLISLASRELRIDPTHRAIQAPVEIDTAAPLALKRQPFQGASGSELAAAVARAPQPALGVWAAGGEPEIWHFDPDRLSSTGSGKADLAVTVLHDHLLPATGLPATAAFDGTIRYHDESDRLYEMVRSGETLAAFWLPPMSPEAFAAAIAAGELLPPKSTRFVPKLASGLVWVDHDAAIL